MLVEAARIEPASRFTRKERWRATSVVSARFPAEFVAPSSPLESPQSWRHAGDRAADLPRDRPRGLEPLEKPVVGVEADVLIGEMTTVRRRHGIPQPLTGLARFQENPNRALEVGAKEAIFARTGIRSEERPCIRGPRNTLDVPASLNRNLVHGAGCQRQDLDETRCPFFCEIGYPRSSLSLQGGSYRRRST